MEDDADIVLPEYHSGDDEEECEEMYVCVYLCDMFLCCDRLSLLVITTCVHAYVCTVVCTLAGCISK